MNERRDPATGELLETVDFAPKILAYACQLMDEYLDVPQNVEHVLCCLRTIDVGITHYLDEKINIDLDIHCHYKKSSKILDISSASVYNYDKEYKKIPALDRFSKI